MTELGGQTGRAPACMLCGRPVCPTVTPTPSPAAPGALSLLQTASIFITGSLPDTELPLLKSTVNWVSAFLSGTSFIIPPPPQHPRQPPPPSSTSSTLCSNPLPTQAAVKVRWFYMVRLQCPCPISLWSEAGLNMPILILPNKLNHAGQWKGAGVAGTYGRGGRRWRGGCGSGGGRGEGGGEQLSTWLSSSLCPPL